MKKFLLFGVAALMMTGASAQVVKKAAVPAKQQTVSAKIMKNVKPRDLMKKETAQMRTPGSPVLNKAPKKAKLYDVHYRRPAGAFFGNTLINPDGTYLGGFYSSSLHVKPFAPYTYIGIADGADETTNYAWDYWVDDELYQADGMKDLEVTYGWNVDTIPIFYAIDGPIDPSSKWYDFQYKGYKMSGTSDKPIIDASYIDDVMAASNPGALYSDVEEGGGLLVSSKNFCYGGVNGDQRYPQTYYSGAQPYDPRGEEGSGYWFGKNGSGFNGMAQAFEKPEHPYVLRRVVASTAVLTVKPNTTVDMTCRVYKIDGEIPAYNDSLPVQLPAEPGELIATGRCTVTPETNATYDGDIVFTLYDYEDDDPELEFEVTPTIDFPILVCLDGYNDPEMSNLADFSLCIASDDMTDEGFGELCYIRYPVRDDQGNITEDFRWVGLNNFFTSGEMKTGVTLFLDIDHPFMTFKYNLEDGEYTFPNEGGLMRKELYNDGQQQLVTESIEFLASYPSVDEGWTLTCNGQDVPEWLNIQLIDQEENGEFNEYVTAKVTADALPAGMAYREAVVRFEIPGAYIDYTFKQGVKPIGVKGDVNGDGEVGIADINYLIDMILSGNTDVVGDVNEDGEVTIGDVSAVLDIMLSM